MKVVAFNGSPRKNGNTTRLIKCVFKQLEKADVECELVELGGHVLRGCMACSACKQNKDRKCVISNDIINECIAKISESDGVIIGSPVYFGTITAETKAFIDRVGYVSRANDQILHRKVGAAVVSARRAGSLVAFDAINHFFLINEMIVPGSSYWNLAIGREIGEVESDQEGISTMEKLGENMAWLLKKIKNN